MAGRFTRLELGLRLSAADMINSAVVLGGRES